MFLLTRQNVYNLLHTLMDVHTHTHTHSLTHTLTHSHTHSLTCIHTQSCYVCEEQGLETQATYGACMSCHKSSCRLAFHVTW